METKEKINSLAVLFAQRESIDLQIAGLLGGSAEVPMDSQFEDVRIKRKYKKRKKEILPEEEVLKPKKKRKQTKWTRANPMPETLKDEMRKDYQNGEKINDLVNKYDLSYPTIHKIVSVKATSATTKNNQVQEYVCENGHGFKSKLLPGDVMCPTCHTYECDLQNMNGSIIED